MFEVFNFKLIIPIYTDNKFSKITIENGEISTKLKRIAVKILVYILLLLPFMYIFYIYIFYFYSVNIKIYIFKLL